MQTNSSRYSLLLIVSLVAAFTSAALLLEANRTSVAGAAAPGTRSAFPTVTTEALPPGASAQPMLSGMDNPIAMAFDPQGRLFYTEKVTGNVRLFANGVLQANPVINFAVDSNGERGLLGITLDPNFNTNHYIYVYYTCAVGTGCPSTENRVVRFMENNGTGSNPVTIFTSPQIATNHVGGNIHFGPDGKLYISIGDSGCCPQYAQDVNARQGKIHRINSDGSIPADNPVFTQTGTMTATYAMGLRNSFDFTFDPLDTSAPYRIFASENGPNCDDELNRIEPGYNYGWRPNYPCDDPSGAEPQYNTIQPLWYVPSGTCCVAPTGIHIYTGASVPQWRNDLFMCSYNDGVLRHFYLTVDRLGVTTVATVNGITCNMDIETGPDGAFYYIQGGGYSAGTLMRITGSGPAQTATATTAVPSSTPTAIPTGSVTPTACSIAFSDVPPGSTFYTYVECLACRGIVSGYPDGTFHPNDPVTRGQLSKIVALSAEMPPPNQGQAFEDVPPSNPFWQYVEPLAARNVIGGYPCGGPGEPCVPPTNRPYFRPNSNVSRGQTSKIVALAAQVPPPNQGQAFEDVPPGNPFWQYVEALAARDAIGGYACGGPDEPCKPPTNRPYFRPGANVSRGQSAKIVSIVFFPGCQPSPR